LRRRGHSWSWLDGATGRPAQLYERPRSTGQCYLPLFYRAWRRYDGDDKASEPKRALVTLSSSYLPFLILDGLGPGIFGAMLKFNPTSSRLFGSFLGLMDLKLGKSTRGSLPVSFLSCGMGPGTHNCDARGHCHFFLRHFEQGRRCIRGHCRLHRRDVRSSEHVFVFHRHHTRHPLGPQGNQRRQSASRTRTIL
jgi:hypothetical protein